MSDLDKLIGLLEKALDDENVESAKTLKDMIKSVVNSLDDFDMVDKNQEPIQTDGYFSYGKKLKIVNEHLVSEPRVSNTYYEYTFDRSFDLSSDTTVKLDNSFNYYYPTYYII